jgi:toxin ParE1/3/4
VRRPQRRVSALADDDILAIILHSEKQFGIAAGRRYIALINTAILDIAGAPLRPGSIARPDIGTAVRSYHLRHSVERARIPEGVVRRPRHLLLYRIGVDGIAGVGRVLHDAMDPHRHLPTDYGGS